MKFYDNLPDPHLFKLFIAHSLTVVFGPNENRRDLEEPRRSLKQEISAMNWKRQSLNPEALRLVQNFISELNGEHFPNLKKVLEECFLGEPAVASAVSVSS